jgi:chromosome partitioning protein
MITIALVLPKGGVGKTTTTVSLAVELARHGQRVLCVDTDYQSDLTTALGVSIGEDDPMVYEVLLNPALSEQLPIVETAFGVDLLPASKRLDGAQERLANKYGRELLLKNGLRCARLEYDYILIDSPPSIGLMTANALVAADTIIVPLQAHYLALNAMEKLNETILDIRTISPELHIGGIVITMVDKRTALSRDIEQEARRAYGALVFETMIPLSTYLAEAPSAGQPIATYAANSAGAVAYAALAEEVRLRWSSER